MIYAVILALAAILGLYCVSVHAQSVRDERQQTRRENEDRRANALARQMMEDELLLETGADGVIGGNRFDEYGNGVSRRNLRNRRVASVPGAAAVVGPTPIVVHPTVTVISAATPSPPSPGAPAATVSQPGGPGTAVMISLPAGFVSGVFYMRYNVLVPGVAPTGWINGGTIIAGVVDNRGPFVAGTQIDVGLSADGITWTPTPRYTVI